MHSILLLVYSSFITIYKEDHINSYHLLKKKKKVIEELQTFLDINWKGTQGGDLFILLYLIQQFPLGFNIWTDSNKFSFEVRQ